MLPAIVVLLSARVSAPKHHALWIVRWLPSTANANGVSAEDSRDAYCLIREFHLHGREHLTEACCTPGSLDEFLSPWHMKEKERRGEKFFFFFLKKGEGEPIMPVPAASLPVSLKRFDKGHIGMILAGFLY